MDNDMDFDIDTKPECHMTAGQKAVATLPNLRERLVQRRDHDRSIRVRAFLEKLLHS
jgi:hypothetical protein